MVLYSPHRKFTSCFQFQVNLTFNDFTAQIMLKVICVPNISFTFWQNYTLCLVIELNTHSTTTHVRNKPIYIHETGLDLC